LVLGVEYLGSITGDWATKGPNCHEWPWNPVVVTRVWDLVVVTKPRGRIVVIGP